MPIEKEESSPGASGTSATKQSPDGLPAGRFRILLDGFSSAVANLARPSGADEARQAVGNRSTRPPNRAFELVENNPEQTVPVSAKERIHVARAENSKSLALWSARSGRTSHQVLVRIINRYTKFEWTTASERPLRHSARQAVQAWSRSYGEMRPLLALENLARDQLRQRSRRRR
ncbi:MAG: hypothetical protein OXI01_14160 [Albidovulum sp.]|nr:hypothetical protein [Albidovulum sp.]